MDELDLRQLDRANSIIQVAIELGIKVQGNMARCFNDRGHAAEDKAMSLFFNAAKNSFFCKTCPDVGGSVIDLVSQYRGLNREEAIAWLAHRVEFDQMTRRLYYGRGRKKD